MRFYLGTHLPSWLGSVPVPLFVSHRRLARAARLPVARTRWALDSGGFSELSLFGAWRTPPAVYAAAIIRYRDEIGALDWAAPQDWMCEPWIVAKTGRTVAEHQWATVASVVDLRARVGPLVVPVLQGWRLADYEACAELYRDEGFDLTAEPVVGLGSVCRRQGTGGIAAIVAEWSYNARRHTALPGCPHRNCANCPRWALRWRERVVAQAATQQLAFRFVPATPAAA